MDAAVGKIAEKAMDMLFKFIGGHIRYLVGYKRYIKNLEDEMERLEEVKLRIEGMVEEARSNAEVIDRGVEQWLEEVRQKQEEVVGEQRKGLMSEYGLTLSAWSKWMQEGGGCDWPQTKRGWDGFVEGGSVGCPAPLTDVWYTHAADYKPFDSRDSIFREIMEALRNYGKYMIGIQGMPGVGKTRMADEVAKQAEEDKLFERETASQTLDWESIQ